MDNFVSEFYAVFKCNFPSIQQRYIYPFAKRLITSNRTPEECIKLAQEIGMFVPYNCRYGLRTYAYVLQHLSEYENVRVDRKLEKYMFYTLDPAELMMYSDYELLRMNDNFARVISRTMLLNEIKARQNRFVALLEYTPNNRNYFFIHCYEDKYISLHSISHLMEIFPMMSFYMKVSLWFLLEGLYYRQEQRMTICNEDILVVFLEQIRSNYGNMYMI